LLPQHSTAAQVIAGVNSLRASRGLTPFQTNSILMRVCQAQADYMASIGTYSDTDAQGRGSKQRLLDAGYPAARASENVFEGTNATAQEAINFWMSDALHRIALLDPELADVGAGVTVVGDTYYYCQIAALSTGGKVSTSVPATLAPIVIPIVVSTPNPDGSIVHVIHQGDSLFAIAQAYGIPLITLEQLNTLTATTIIYPGRKLIIRPAFTPTVTVPAATPFSTSTSILTSTRMAATSSEGITTPVSGLPASKAGGAVAIIVLVALAFAGAITALGAKNRR
jgi:LysM repeat protein